MGKSKLLRLGKRERIYDYILKYPGLHIRDLSRSLNMSKTTLIYHLRYLKKHRFIEENLYENYTRYYAVKQIDRNHKKMLNLLREKATRRVILYIALNHFSSIDEISKHIHKDRSTVSHHLKKLNDAGVLQCRKINGEKKYVLYEGTGQILAVAINYQNSFIDYKTRRIIKKALRELEKHEDWSRLIDSLSEIFPHPYHV